MEALASDKCAALIIAESEEKQNKTIENYQEKEDREHEEW